MIGKQLSVESLVSKIIDTTGDNRLFSLIVSNPPYQENVRESRVSSQNTANKPVYPEYVENAKIIGKTSLIICPGRWLFDAGRTSKEWNQDMLNDPAVSIPFYTYDSTSVFSNAKIRGGICIIMNIKNRTNAGLNGVFFAYEELKTILEKVSKVSQNSFSEIVSVGLEYRTLDNKEIDTNAFSLNKGNIFSETKLSDNHVEVLGLMNAKRHYMWIDRNNIVCPVSFEKWKVIIPKANMNGTFGEKLSQPIVGKPFLGITGTFMTLGSFETEFEAVACLKYIKTKFVRSMLGILKVTQDNSRRTWKYVPLQNFTKNSDIDWSKSIDKIDKQLYEKYKLSDKEVCFIETNTQNME